MRLIRLCTNYPAFLRDFYARRPELLTGTYRQQYEGLCAEHFGWADCWTNAFSPLGYEVWEPVANAEVQQRAWAAENNVSFDARDWLLSISLAQVEHYRPDIVLVNDYATFPKTFFEEMRRRVPGVRLVVGWCGAPYRDATVFEGYDIVMSNIPSLVEGFRKAGHRSEWMAHCFDARVLSKLGQIRKRHDFTFIGSLVKRPGFHNQREVLLEALTQRSSLRIFADIGAGKTFKESAIRVAASGVRALRPIPLADKVIRRTPVLRRLREIGETPRAVDPVPASIRRAARPAVFGLPMFRTLAESKLTLNTHIDIAIDYASNMRLFEATGVGACLLTERQADLDRLFRPDVEVATYASVDEAVEKANYLLANDKVREDIAHAGQRRTLTDHSFVQRARWLDGLFRANMK